MSTEFNVEYSFNTVLDKLFRANGVDAYMNPCACVRPITDNGWTINVEYALRPLPLEKWHQPRFRFVIHAQDFVHWYGDCCLELLWLEKQFTPSQLKKVIFVHWDHNLQNVYKGPISCIEFPTHSYELVTTLQKTYQQWKHVHEKMIRYNWLCLNGRSRQYRKDVYNLLKDYQTGFCSHGVLNPVPQHPYKDYDFNNVQNFIKLVDMYRFSKVSVVTESIYADTPGIITEKTLLAIAAKHPFMIIGHRGIHNELTNRGFELYDDLFDYSYDDEPMETRLYSAIEKNLDVLNGDIDLDLYQDKVDRNFDYLMSDYLPTITENARQQILNHLVKF